MSKCKCDFCQKVYPAMQWVQANAPIGSGHYDALSEALMCNDQVKEDCAMALGKRDAELARLRAELAAARRLLNHTQSVMACAECALIGSYPPDLRGEVVRQLDSGEWLRRRKAIGERFDTIGRGMAILNLRDAQKLAEAAKEGKK